MICDRRRIFPENLSGPERPFENAAKHGLKVGGRSIR